MKNILITGGIGFIGSHVVEYFAKKYSEYNFFVVDKLTYAADLNFLNEIKNSDKYFNVKFHKADICDAMEMMHIFEKYKITHVIHLAAESHVDNSIDNPFVFVETNVIGTLNLLNAARINWVDSVEDHLFYHVSTDEVYGALGEEGQFYETTPYDPKSPYSASKASSDHFVRAYGNTYGLKWVISNCSNNYGERQHEEKLIPKTIKRVLTGEKVPVYGDGSNIRDWLYVKDHVKAIDFLFHNAKNDTYNIGGDCEMKNIDLVNEIINNLIFLAPSDKSDYIEFVEDRKGHDYRYSINCDKIKKDFNWKPITSFKRGIDNTINFYIKKYKK